MSNAVAERSVYSHRKGSLNLAMLLCFVTTAVGIGCLLGYVLTRQDGFAEAGLVVFTLLLPTAGLLSLGLIGWSIYLSSRAKPSDRSLRTLSALAIFALLVMPVMAILCFVIGANYATRFDVIVSNRSPFEVTNIQIFGGGSHDVIPELKPGMSQEVTLHFESDGQLEIGFDSSGETVKPQVIQDYVTNLMGGCVEVQIQSDLSLVIVR